MRPSTIKQIEARRVKNAEKQADLKRRSAEVVARDAKLDLDIRISAYEEESEKLNIVERRSEEESEG
jgi:hypothetical protein